MSIFGEVSFRGEILSGKTLFRDDSLWGTFRSEKISFGEVRESLSMHSLGECQLRTQAASFPSAFAADEFSNEKSESRRLAQPHSAMHWDSRSGWRSCTIATYRLPIVRDPQGHQVSPSALYYCFGGLKGRSWICLFCISQANHKKKIHRKDGTWWYLTILEYSVFRAAIGKKYPLARGLKQSIRVPRAHLCSWFFAQEYQKCVAVSICVLPVQARQVFPHSGMTPNCILATGGSASQS